MKDQRRREKVCPNFPVIINNEQGSYHHDIYEEDKVEITGWNIDLLSLGKFVEIDAESH